MSLQGYVVIVKKWWGVVISAVLVSAAVGYGISQRQPTTYEAVTTLLVGRSIQAAQLTTDDLTISDRLALTYANVALRQPVLQGVVDALHLRLTWPELQKRVRVDIVRDTQLLEIRAQAATTGDARAIADELAHQLILQGPTADLKNQSNGEALQFLLQQLQDLQAKIKAGQAKAQELKSELSASPAPANAQQLQADLDALERSIDNWQTSYIQLLPFSAVGKSSNALNVIEPAHIDPAATRPRTLLNTLLASAVGLLLAVGAVWLLEYQDKTFKSAADLSALGLTYLGAIGRMDSQRYQRKLISTHGPFSPASEAYRIIRGNIQYTNADGLAKSIMVTSPGPGEGKSTTTANLGVVIAQAGFETILVDADLRQPALHQIFEIPNHDGLTNLLGTPELEIDSRLRDTGVEHLKVITSGPVPLNLNPSEMLSSPRMKQLLAALKYRADVVILDSPAALGLADAGVLSAQVAGVVLVLEAGRTRPEAAQQAKSDLQQVGARFLGMILNRATGQGNRDYAAGPSRDFKREEMRDSLSTNVQQRLKAVLARTLDRVYPRD